MRGLISRLKPRVKRCPRENLKVRQRRGFGLAGGRTKRECQTNRALPETLQILWKRP
jgi:hypothetical protein